MVSSKGLSVFALKNTTSHTPQSTSVPCVIIELLYQTIFAALSSMILYVVRSGKASGSVITMGNSMQGDYRVIWNVKVAILVGPSPTAAVISKV